MDCRDCKYFFEDEDRRLCTKTKKPLWYLGECGSFDDGTTKKKEEDSNGKD